MILNLSFEKKSRKIQKLHIPRCHSSVETSEQTIPNPINVGTFVVCVELTLTRILCMLICV